MNNQIQGCDYTAAFNNPAAIILPKYDALVNITQKPVWAESCIYWFYQFKKGLAVQGAGFRGGNWNNNSNNLRVSDRNNAANTNNNRNNNYGGRGVRTAP